MPSIKKFIQNETLLFISFVLAAISMCLIWPDRQYFTYINPPVIILLFCLMSVIVGLQRMGIFFYISASVLQKTNRSRWISLALILLCFISSMFITNDVSLLTFVPLTLQLFEKSNHKKLIFIVVMETISSNLGSMVTPIGNPQNLYLYAYYHMSIVSFLKLMLPLGLISLFMILVITLCMKDETMRLNFEGPPLTFHKKGTYFYILLFIICLLTLFHVISIWICLGIITGCILFFDRETLKHVDYALLLTFVFFFIFIGNISRMDMVKSTVTTLLSGHELLLSVLFCQFISNVPAAMMLAPFVKNAPLLIKGVNIGGLGTIIASLASLISLKFYVRSPKANTGLYMIIFSALNFLMLGILLLFSFR